MKKKNSQEKYGDKAIYVVIDVLSYFIMGGLFGYYLDYTFKTMPIFTIIFITIGGAIAMYTSYKTITEN